MCVWVLSGLVEERSKICFWLVDFYFFGLLCFLLFCFVLLNVPFFSLGIGFSRPDLCNRYWNVLFGSEKKINRAIDLRSSPNSGHGHECC